MFVAVNLERPPPPLLVQRLHPESVLFVQQLINEPNYGRARSLLEEVEPFRRGRGDYLVVRRVKIVELLQLYDGFPPRSNFNLLIV